MLANLQRPKQRKPARRSALSRIRFVASSATLTPSRLPVKRTTGARAALPPYVAAVRASASTQSLTVQFSYDSLQVLDAYRAGAFELVERACADAKYLERLTGLDKLEEETEKLLAEGVDWEEEDEGDGDDF